MREIVQGFVALPIRESVAGTGSKPAEKVRTGRTINSHKKSRPNPARSQGSKNIAGKGHGGPCLTDVAQSAVPGALFVECRYAAARTMKRRSSRPD
jgi:hypothetical protein